MSIDTYLSLLFGSILGIIVTVYLAIIQTKDNKEGKKQIEKHKKLILVFIVLAIILTVYFLYSERQHKLTAFNIQTSSAEFDLTNGDYLNAAEHYDQAAFIAFDEDSFLEAVYGKGLCYLLHGMYSNDYDYFNKATSIYLDIIKQPRYRSSMYYIDSLADLSFIYLFQECPWDDPVWFDLITRLEDVFASEPITEIEKISSSELSLRLKVTYALAAYYEYVTHFRPENTLHSEYSSKALVYFEELSTLYRWTVNFRGAHVLPGFDTHSIIRISNSMFAYAISSNAPAAYCTAAIELCKTELSRSDTSAIPIVDTINLRQQIGKGLYILSIVDKENADNYLQEMYSTLAPMLNIKNEDAQSSLMDLAYYLVRSNLCTELETNQILDIYSYSLSLMPASSDPTTRVKWLLSACEVCRYISEKYDYSTDARNIGAVYVNELKTTLVDYLNSDQLSSVDNLYLFFYN